MKNKVFTKILCLMISVICVFSGLVVPGSAAINIDSTDVMSDLEKMKDFKIEQYDKNEKDNYISLITFDEYGYDYNGFSNDYGLYVYIYNPSGKKILDNGKAKIQISIDQNKASYQKYDLTLISYSVKEGYEHVFYKYQVKISSSFYTKLLPSKREYKISGIELQREGELLDEHDISSTYTYTGFSAYHGSDRTSDHSTLYCNTDNLETVSLDIYPASWKTKTSDKGKNHQYEISSIYFAVPNYWLEKYGSKTDLYKGLYGLTAEWFEYKTNGILTSNDRLYNEALSFENHIDIDLGKPDFSIPFMFQVLNAEGDDKCYYNFYPWPSSSVDKLKSSSISSIKNVIKIPKGTFIGLSPLDTLNALRNDDGSYNIFSYVDDGRIYGYNKKEFTVEDGALNAQINSYASNHWDFWTVLAGFEDLNEDQNGYEKIDVFEKITEEDFIGSSIQVNADKLFISLNDYYSLRSYFDSVSSDEYTVYLLRFAVTDYVMGEISVDKTGDPFTDEDYYGSNNYYFEKSIFTDFDVLDMTFRNEKGEFKTLPVNSKPIDIGGSITPGPSLPDDPDPDPEPEINIAVVLLIILMVIIVTIALVYGAFKLWGYLSGKVEKISSKIEKKFKKNNKRKE